jgi:hypothetical protein
MFEKNSLPSHPTFLLLLMLIKNPMMMMSKNIPKTMGISCESKRKNFRNGQRRKKKQQKMVNG